MPALEVCENPQHGGAMEQPTEPKKSEFLKTTSIGEAILFPKKKSNGLHP